MRTGRCTALSRKLSPFGGGDTIASKCMTFYSNQRFMSAGRQTGLLVSLFNKQPEFSLQKRKPNPQSKACFNVNI